VYSVDVDCFAVTILVILPGNLIFRFIPDVVLLEFLTLRISHSENFSLIMYPVALLS